MRWAVLVLLVTIRTVCVCVPVCAIHCCCLSAVFQAPLSLAFFPFFILHWPFWECVRFGIRNSNCILLITSSSVHCSYYATFHKYITTLSSCAFQPYGGWRWLLVKKRLTSVDHGWMSIIMHCMYHG